MSLRRALHLLIDRYRGEPLVWLVGLAFGVALGAGYAGIFVVDATWANAAGYAVFVLFVAPLFGAALWPFVAGDPPESARALVQDSLRRYPRLLAARAGYVALLVAGVLALVSLVGGLATAASLANYLTGGGATTLPPERANEVAGVALLLLGLAGATAVRLLFGFVDAATLRRGRLRGALDEALSTALRAPFRAGTAAIALAVYRVGLPLIALVVVGRNADHRGSYDVLFATPQLAVVPPDAPSYASPPDPSIAPALLVGLVVADVVLTALVWPVAYGYHLALFEALRSDGGSGGTPDAATTAGGSAQ